MASNAAFFVTNIFLTKHISLNEDWLESVLQYLEHQNYPQHDLAKAVFDQWLYSNITESTHPSFQLPPDSCKKIDGIFVFQVKSVIDIGSSAFSQYRIATQKMDNYDFFDALPKEDEPKEVQFVKKANRMLLLELTNGNQTLKAIEFSAIPELSASIFPGAKIMIFGVIQKRKNVLWLTQRNCQLLGGELDTHCNSNQKETMLGRKLKIKKYNNMENAPQILLSELQSNMVVNAASFVTNFFLTKHISLNEDWLESVLQYLEHQNYPQHDLAKAVFDQWLYSNITESTHPSFQLPPDSCKKIDGIFVFQVKSVIDIGSSAFSQYRIATQKMDNYDFFDALPKEDEPKEVQFVKKANRMLLLELTNGNQTLKAIEFSAIPELSASIFPGAKIMIFGVIQKRKNVLWLTQRNCQLLGGELDTLCNSNQKETMLGRKLKIKKYDKMEDRENVAPIPPTPAIKRKKHTNVPEVIMLSP